MVSRRIFPISQILHLYFLLTRLGVLGARSAPKTPSAKSEKFYSMLSGWITFRWGKRGMGNAVSKAVPKIGGPTLSLS